MKYACKYGVNTPYQEFLEMYLLLKLSHYLAMELYLFIYLFCMYVCI